MRPRAEPTSRTDRVASTAAACGMTIAAALVVLTSAAARFVPTDARASTSDTEPVSHPITFVRRVVPPVTPMRSRPRPSPRRTPVSPAPASMPTSLPRVAPADSSASARASVPSPNATHSAVSDFERRWTAHGVSPLLLPGSAPNAAYAAPAAGATVRIPTAPGDHDAQARAQADEDMAAQAAGAPMSPTPHGGITLDAPIPFGGPSNAQRKRDSTVNAQTMVVLKRVLQRLDSIAAARKRDSVAALERHP